MMSPEEVLARKLCMCAGHSEGACDELVYRTLPFEVNTPEGKAYGGIIPHLKPLWMFWLNEAVSMRFLAYEMAQDMVKTQR